MSSLCVLLYVLGCFFVGHCLDKGCFKKTVIWCLAPRFASWRKFVILNVSAYRCQNHTDRPFANLVEKFKDRAILLLRVKRVDFRVFTR